MNDIQEEVLKAVEITVDERLRKFNCIKVSRGKVVSINGENCVVKINNDNSDCKILNNINISVNDIVNVLEKNNNFGDKFVIGKLGTVGSGGTGGSTITDSATNGNIVVDGSEVNVYTHPTTHSADIIVDGTTNKAFTATEKTKLAGIASGAEVNVNADWNAASGDAQILNKPTIPTQTSQLTNNSNYVSDALYVHTDNNYTTTEKNKLAGIADNANNYSHPSTHSASMITLADTGNHFTATDIEGAMAELFTSVDSGKTSVYSAIVGKGQTPTSTNFADLVTAIGNIVTGSTGAHYASGTANSDASGFLTVSGLTFTPKYVMWFLTAGIATGRGSFGIFSDTSEIGYYISSAVVRKGLSAKNVSGTITMTDFSSGIVSDGFSANVSLSFPSRPYKWIAVAP